MAKIYILRKTSKKVRNGLYVVFDGDLLIKCFDTKELKEFSHGQEYDGVKNDSCTRKWP